MPGRRRLSQLLHTLYTEADSPPRQAAAVALGLFIGCSPFYGFHLLLAVLLGSLFRLNRLKVYVAANISNPLVAPFLLAAELQVGAWARGRSLYWPTTLDGVSVWGVTLDLLVGSIIVGGIFGIVGGAFTYTIVTRRAFPRTVATLVEEASERYLRSGFRSWQFARGKLRYDPMYLEILKQGLLPGGGTLVDCGCGQGVMLALLAAAKKLHERHIWPPGWPAPPSTLTLTGIEDRPRSTRQARLALGDEATILEGDLRRVAIPRCDVALLLDVVHLMPEPDQDDLLVGVRGALNPGGLVILREADASGGWRFRAVQTVNWLVRAVQGQWRRRFYFRTATEWCQHLTQMGFEVSIQPMNRGTPFANVLLYARRIDVTTPRLDPVS